MSSIADHIYQRMFMLERGYKYMIPDHWTTEDKEYFISNYEGQLNDMNESDIDLLLIKMKCKDRTDGVNETKFHPLEVTSSL